MKDRLIIGTCLEGKVRIIACNTTELVNEAIKIHNTSKTASAAFGRLLTAGTLMGSMLKSKEDSLTIKISGDGPVKSLLVTAHSDSSVKGYVGNSEADLPLNLKGKLDVSGIIGHGSLTVIRDMGLKEPYVATIPLKTGEIGDDLAYYFTVSEQTPSAVGLGVLVDMDYTVKAAGGFIIQMLPGADELVADLVSYRLEEITSITDLIVQGMDAEAMMKSIFYDMDFKLLDEIVPQYKCDCNRERVLRALISIGEKDLREIYDEGTDEQIKCNFCNVAYNFTHEDIGNLLQKNISK